MRPSTVAVAVFGALVLLVAGTAIDARIRAEDEPSRVSRQADLVARLGLTDLSLFTEARYTRHRALADLHSAFQDHPHGLDHFPSGSLAPPPAHLLRLQHEPVDRETTLPR